MFDQQMEFAAGQAFATGQTQAAVDIALEFNRRYPHNPRIAITFLEQSRDVAPKHSSGKTLYHIVKQAEKRYLIDNCMSAGDVSVTVEGREQEYKVCPLSSIGALTVVHSLNELTIRELVRQGHKPSGAAEYASWPDAGEPRSGAREPAPALYEGAVEPAGLRQFHECPRQSRAVTILQSVEGRGV